MQYTIREASRGSTRAMGAVFAVGLLLTIASVLFGRFDDDVIDIAATITTSNEKMMESGGTNAEMVPVPAAGPAVQNGGLVGIGNTTPPPAETGTTTDGSATTTDSGDTDSGTTDDADNGDATASEASTETTSETASPTESETPAS